MFATYFFLLLQNNLLLSPVCRLFFLTFIWLKTSGLRAYYFNYSAKRVEWLRMVSKPFRLGGGEFNVCRAADKRICFLLLFYSSKS
jgi:hypothetical protein